MVRACFGVSFHRFHGSFAIDREVRAAATWMARGAELLTAVFLDAGYNAVQCLPHSAS